MAINEGKGFGSIRIIGSGLIGTSIGLALASRGVQVEMLDRDPKAQKLAQDLIASEVAVSPELTLFAIPANALAQAFEREFALNPGSKFIDIASVKTKPQVEVSRISGAAKRFLATHPMAGREVGEPPAPEQIYSKVVAGFTAQLLLMEPKLRQMFSRLASG